MSEITICPVTTKEEAQSASTLLHPKVVEALKKGLPMTAMVAVEEDKAIGALAGAVDGDVFEIVSLYVVPERRRLGAGKALMEKLRSLGITWKALRCLHTFRRMFKPAHRIFK